MEARRVRRCLVSCLADTAFLIHVIRPLRNRRSIVVCSICRSFLQESSHLTEGPIAFERHHRDLAKHVASIRICELPDLSSIESTPDSMDIEDMNNNTTTTSTSSTTTPLGALDLQDVSVPFWKCACKLHVYKLDSDGPSQEFTGGGDTNDEDGISCDVDRYVDIDYGL